MYELIRSGRIRAVSIRRSKRGNRLRTLEEKPPKEHSISAEKVRLVNDHLRSSKDYQLREQDDFIMREE